MTLTTITAAIAATLVAIVGLWQSPYQRVNQAFALGMAMVAAVEVARTFAVLAEPQIAQLDWSRIVLLAEGLWPACWFFFSMTYARAGKTTLAAKPRLAVALLALLPLAIALLAWEGLLALPLDSYEPGRYLVLGPWGRLFVGVVLVGLIAPLVNLEATLRASTGIGRWHIKFMVLGVGLLLGFEIYFLSYQLLFSAIDSWVAGPQAVVVIIATGLMAVSLVRSRHGTVELSVSQTALFGSVVLVFIGGYLIAIGGLAQVWSLVGGSATDLWQGVLLLVALAGLASLILSSRLKAQVKQVLSRHFYPHRYDYRQEWLQLTERMSHQLGLEASLRVVVERLSEAFDAPRVSAWLFDETARHLQLTATVQLSPSDETAWRTQPIAVSTLAGAISAWEGPRVVEPLPPDLASQTSSDLHALVQRTKAHLVAPLVTGGRALGLLAIGAPVTERGYGQEELLLAGAMAQQSAAYVLTARLSQELMRTREVELSQLFSTFFIHDLKNLGTPLSLVVQNLPLCYDNPRFRNDAQRVISETIEKIKELTNKVTTLSQQYELALEPADLNQVAEESLEALNGSVTFPVTRELEPLPPIMLDRRHMRSVLTNLLLNAQEATGHSGSAVRLRTQHRDGWAVLSVIDHGCGITQDFIDQHLFQPFRSTKPGGLGIGLYQCRKIMEAHGGRIEVESRVGKGTTITVLLPTHGGNRQ